MNNVILEAAGLRVSFEKSDFVLERMDFSIREGEIIAIIGESGSGKSTLLKALTCLSDADAVVEGQVLFGGTDLLALPERRRKDYRFRRFSIVFQNSREYLNPRATLREMLYEILKKEYRGAELEKKAREAMTGADLSPDLLDQHPQALSGGMVQKFQIACATALSPELILLDEPTSSLDAASRSEFIRLIAERNRTMHTAVIVVTHDMALARDLSARMLILYQGVVCEMGQTCDILRQPRHPYTRALLNSAMELNLYKDIWGIRESDSKASTGCPFCGRCTQSIPACASARPVLQKLPDVERWIACCRGGIIRRLECHGLKKSFGKKEVLRDCELELYGGEIISLVGRSGSGKTTMCNLIAGFLTGDGGEVRFDGNPMTDHTPYQKRHGFQFVMQDHGDALNRHVTVYEAVNEPLYLFENHDDHRAAVKEVLAAVGLEHDDAFLQRKISTLSGGQRQRAAIARALVTEPAVLVADEPTSMLDSSSKANLIRLLKGIQNTSGFSMLIVTHDLACALKISDRIYLLQDGHTQEVPRDIAPAALETMMYDSASK